jgi:hypothetical protein
MAAPVTRPTPTTGLKREWTPVTVSLTTLASRPVRARACRLAFLDVQGTGCRGQAMVE